MLQHGEGGDRVGAGMQGGQGAREVLGVFGDEVAADQVGEGLVHGCYIRVLIRYKKADMSRKAKGAGPPAVPRVGEGKRGPEGHLGYLVRQANVALRAAMEKALADLAVTPPQFAVLTMIVVYPGVSGAHLARLTFLTPQTINVIVRNLERAGAIEKSAHAVHGRILQLTATAKGQALLKRCRTRVNEIEARLAGLVGREEEQAVRRWLSAVAEALGQ
jgi:DNA-binding MarR family transcriptional regulator